MLASCQRHDRRDLRRHPVGPLPAAGERAYATADGTAAAGVDYVAAAGTLTFAAGQTVQTITVQVNAAPEYDVARTSPSTSRGPSSASIATAQATGTIVNPNIPPQIAISSASVIASTSGTTTAAFTVSLSAPSAQPVTRGLRHDRRHGAPARHRLCRYVRPRRSPSPRAPTEQTVTVTVNPEPAGTPHEGLRGHPFQARRRRDSAGFTGGRGDDPRSADAAGGLDRRRDGDRQPQRRPPPTFTVSLSAAFDPARDRQLTPRPTARPTAGLRLCRHPRHAADLRRRPDRADRHGHGQPRADRRWLTKTFDVNLSNPGPAGVTIPSGRGHRHDPRTRHPAGRLDRSGVGSRQLPGARPKRPSSSPCRRLPAQTVTVDYATADGTATAGRLRRHPAGDAHLHPGPDRSRPSRSRSMPAPQYDLAKTFSVGLSNPVGATINTGQRATGTIENPNAPPQAAIGNATVTASPGGPTAATFTVTLSAALRTCR